MSVAKILSGGLDALGLSFDAAIQLKLLSYINLLDKWNRTYNLTAIREPERMVAYHLLDSLAVLTHLPAGHLADIGSGGGLPGLPIAIAQPARQVSVNDSNTKKAAFMRQAGIELELNNLQVHAGRAEAWQPSTLFDVVISRAFAEIADFITASRHLLKPGGIFAAMKGIDPHAELATLPQDIEVLNTIHLQVPGLDASRCLVLLRVGS